MEARGIVAVGLCALLAGCVTHTCTDVGCLGQEVSVELVDDADHHVAARGEVAYSHHSTKPFDCTLPPDPSRNDIPCDSGVLTLESVYNPTDTIQVRFDLPDGTFTDWQPVTLSIQKKVLPNVNGPDCDCTIYNGTTPPVTVPEPAR